MAGKVREGLGYEPSVEFVKRIFGDKIVAYYAGLARALGGVKAALMLQQCIYWACRTVDPDGWFYKTIEDFQSELALTRHEQEHAINILIKAEFIEKEVRGIPPKRYFRVNLDRVAAFLQKYRATQNEHE